MSKKTIKEPVIHSIEAEQGVLGCILIDDELITKLAYSLSPSDFYSTSHQYIYKTMLDLYNENVKVDFITITSSLEKQGILEDIGGLSYISTLSNILPSSVMNENYLKTVLEYSKKRKMLKLIELAKEDIFGDNFDSALDRLQKDTIKVMYNQEESSSDASIVSALVHQRFKKIAMEGYTPSGVPIGYPKLSQMLESFVKGDMIIIGARPSVGKTSFALNLTKLASIQMDYKTLFFSLEMSKDRLVERLMADIGDYSNSKARVGQLEENELTKIDNAYKQMQKSKIVIDDKSGITPQYIRNRALEVKAKQGLDIIFIDYLGLIRGDNTKNRTQEVGEISKALKGIARELNVPVVVLSQLSRGVEYREDAKPVLSDLRDSGDIEQDADIVIFLQRHTPKDITNVAEDYTIIVAKNRNGATGNIKYTYYPKRMRFVEEDIKTKIPITKITNEKELNDIPF